MKKRYPKRVNPKPMLTRFQEMFKSIDMKKPTLRNLFFVLVAISVSKTFRINEIASRLPLDVARESSKQKRFLRFLETPLPIDALQVAWFVSCVSWFSKTAGEHLYLLVDETKLLAGWKALVVAIPFRQRAIPVFWFIYKDQQIRDCIYKSHNEIIQYFCEFVYQKALEGMSNQNQRPVLIFDRGFARAEHVIGFLKQRHIPFVMRVPRHVGIFVEGSPMKLDDMAEGWYPRVLYQNQHQIPLQLYIIRDAAFKDPMYLISDRISGHQIHHCYKRRMQIEHAFRDIKTGTSDLEVSS